MKKLILLILTAFTLSQQTYSQTNDTICLPAATYKKVLKLAVTGKYCDSLLIIREAQISEMGEMVDLSEEVIKDQANQIEGLKKFKPLFKIFLGIAIVELIAIVLILI